MEVDLENIRRPVGRPHAGKEKRIPVAISLAPGLLARLDNAARKKNLSRSAAAGMYLSEALERSEMEAPK